VLTRRLLTVGHGTAAASDLLAVLRAAGVERVVDVRSFPGSRRHPQHRREEMERWLPEAGISYAWQRDLGGFRKPAPDSPNTALRNDSFRGYADYMGTSRFGSAVGALLDELPTSVVTILCSETLWWRCHRRLISDAVVLLNGVEVVHLGHDGRVMPHVVTDVARVVPGGGRLVYDGGQERLDLE
jgi:uncharacterized protein (DUF488 family)